MLRDGEYKLSTSNLDLDATNPDNFIACIPCKEGAANFKVNFDLSSSQSCEGSPSPCFAFKQTIADDTASSVWLTPNCIANPQYTFSGSCSDYRESDGSYKNIVLALYKPISPVPCETSQLSHDDIIAKLEINLNS